MVHPAPQAKLLLAMLMGAGLALATPTAAPAFGAAYRTEVITAAGEPVALYAEEAGEGPIVLLIHGLGASAFTWRHIVPDLARTHRVIALDLKGFGRSDKPLDQAYAAKDQAELVAGFIRKRGLEQVTLVGHSFGGAVAVRTAVLLAGEPGRIARLAVIDSPVLPNALPRHFEFVLVPGAPEALLTPLPPDLVARQMLRSARLSTAGITEADIAGYAAPYYELSAKHAFLATARAIVGEKDDGLAVRLKTLRLPALLVWCRADDIVPLAAGKRLARTLPNAQLKTLRGCNHLPQDERPGALMSVLRPFLER